MFIFTPMTIFFIIERNVGKIVESSPKSFHLKYVDLKELLRKEYYMKTETEKQNKGDFYSWKGL